MINHIKEIIAFLDAWESLAVIKTTKKYPFGSI